MRTKEFLSKLEHDRIVQAIQEAEAKTSAEIRVYVQRGKLNGNPLSTAQKRFQKLGMHKTRERNAVLIFVAPRAHKFAVVGDQAIHEKCGETYWRQIVDLMREHFRSERFSDAIVEAIRDIGRVLAEHFPKRSTAVNELPDDIVER
ncbi:MAG: TPM domain-containing protein [Verrucomicrobiota bacterium]|nr:TPM domain-containing protein [Verrucomicrobiota bacterium]